MVLCFLSKYLPFRSSASLTLITSLLLLANMQLQRLSVVVDPAAMDFPSTRSETKTKHMPPHFSFVAPFEQCFWSGSGFNQVSRSGIRIQEGKMNHKKKIEKFGNFMIWSAECSLLRAEGLPCSFDVLKKISKLFSTCNFWSSNPWIRIGSRSGSELNWIRIRNTAFEKKTVFTLAHLLSQENNADLLLLR